MKKFPIVPRRYLQLFIVILLTKNTLIHYDTVKALYSGHHRVLKIVSIIEGCTWKSWKNVKEVCEKILFLWSVLILNVKKRWLTMCKRILHDCIHFLSLPDYPLDIFATEKRVNHGGEYGLEIPANLILYRTDSAIKLVKK